MSKFLLIGLVSKTTPPVRECQPHLHLEMQHWNALALPLDQDEVPQNDAQEAARMLEWAKQQNTILAHYIERSDVIPVSLGSVFSGHSALEKHLHEQQAMLDTIAQKIEGCRQFSLQISAKDVEAAPELPSAPADGGSFLQRRKSQRDKRLHRGGARLGFIGEIASALRKTLPQTRNHDVTGKPLLADLSLMVPRAQEAAMLSLLQNRADQSTALGLALRLIGPTPAYSFVAQGAEHG